MRIRWLMIALLVASAGLAGCSSADQSSGDGGGLELAPAPPGPDGGGGGDDRGGEGGGDEVGGDEPANGDRQVVLRAQLDLVVDDTDEAVTAIRSLVAREDGFIAGADLRRSSENEQLAGWLSLRVPADRLDPVLDELEDLAHEVRSRVLGSEDVTGQALDLDARLTNLRALEVELRELLTEVRTQPGASPENLLAVFDRISQTRGEIERFEAQRDALAELVELATVTVQLTPSDAAKPLANPWSPTEIGRQAARTLVSALQTLVSGLIWLAVAIVPLLALAALVVGSVWAARRRWRRRPAATAAPPEPHRPPSDPLGGDT